MTRKVKVGDKLRFTKSEVNGAREKIGTIVEVVGFVSENTVEVKARNGEAPDGVWWIHEDFIGDGLEFVDEPAQEAHTFKVGDKGETRGGDNYEVTACAKELMIVSICGRENVFKRDGKSRGEGHLTLPPPKRRIKGWYGMTEDKKLHGPYDSPPPKRTEDLTLFIACKYLEFEEGEGL